MSSSQKEKKSSKSAVVKRNLLQKVFYRGVRLASQYASVMIFNLRVYDRHLIPGPGPALILSTHQSHFDPVLVGVTFNERLNYLARRTLFKNRLFGAAISLLDAIELDRDRSGLAGLKETMKRLKRGEKVLIFPEGTRSADGKLAALKPGFLSVAKRSRAPMIPMAITGAFEALPRGSKIPLRHPLRVAVGAPILPTEIEGLDEEAILQLVRTRLLDCQQRATSGGAGGATSPVPF